MFAPPRASVRQRRPQRREDIPVSMATGHTTATYNPIRLRSASCRSRELQSSRTTLAPSTSSYSLASDRECRLPADYPQESWYPVKAPSGLVPPPSTYVSTKRKERHCSVSSEATASERMRDCPQPRTMFSGEALLTDRVALARISALVMERKEPDRAQVPRTMRPRVHRHNALHSLARAQPTSTSVAFPKQCFGKATLVLRKHSSAHKRSQAGLREMNSTTQLTNVVELQQQVEYLTRQLDTKQHIVEGLLKDNQQLNRELMAHRERTRSRAFESGEPSHIEGNSSGVLAQSMKITRSPDSSDSPSLSRGEKLASPSLETTASSPMLLKAGNCLGSHDGNNTTFDRPMHIRESIQQLHTSLQCVFCDK